MYLGPSSLWLNVYLNLLAVGTGEMCNRRERIGSDFGAFDIWNKMTFAKYSDVRGAVRWGRGNKTIYYQVEWFNRASYQAYANVTLWFRRN